MTAPICPHHPQGPKPMQAGKGGAWFCPNRMPDQSWCKHRVAGVAAPSVAAVSAPAAHSPARGGEALAAAALSAASELYKGAGGDFENQVIQTAQRFYAAMKAMVS